MGNTAVETRLENVNEAAFLDIASRYATKNKNGARVVKALVDALGKSENVEGDLSDAFQIIADLEFVAENGQSYTPSTALGFGSDNSATIACGILGRGMTPAKMRSTFAKIGS